MSVEQILRSAGLALFGLFLVGVLGIGDVEAHTDAFFGLGFDVPFYEPYYPPYYYPPYYYAPPPVVYTPPPVIYTPPPVVISEPQQYWYYCDNPQGYYPYVASCSTGWRRVTATPPSGSH